MGGGATPLFTYVSYLSGPTPKLKVVIGLSSLQCKNILEYYVGTGRLAVLRDCTLL